MGKTVQEHEGLLERLGKRLDNANVWYKRIGVVIAIAAAIWGTGVGMVNAFTQSLDDHIGGQLSEVAQDVEVNSANLKDIRLDTLRTQLLLYMYHEPHEHHTILEIAKVYFVDCGGDWVMTDRFKKWAKEEGVEIPFQLKD